MDYFPKKVYKSIDLISKVMYNELINIKEKFLCIN